VVSTVHLVMTVLYLGTIVLMLGEGVLTALRMRGAPQEVLQLRMFSHQEDLNRALIALTMAIILGILAVLPMALEVGVPDLWTYGTSFASAGVAWYAIVRLGSMFRVRGTPGPARAG